MVGAFKDYANELKNKKYGAEFAPINLRVTNEFSNKTSIAYVVNRYMNPIITNYLKSHDIKVNQDLYALSEMVQFIFRSAVREGNKIKLFVPSYRMREILVNWLDNKITF